MNVSLLTDLSLDNMMNGSTDVAALLAFQQAVPLTEIRFLPSLHAKVYVADEVKAIVTSSNLSDNGLVRNFEYGVVIEDREAVRAVRDDVLRYAMLGSPISQPQLELFTRITSELTRYPG